MKKGLAVSPEWRLEKGSISSGWFFAIAAAMGNFFELVAWFVQQGIGLWASFNGAWLVSAGAAGHQIRRDNGQQGQP